MPRTLWRDELGRFTASPAPRDWPLEVQEPAREPSLAADVAVPALQAVVSALAGGCLTAVACWLFGLPSWTIWATVAAVFAISWAVRLQFSEASTWRTASPVPPEPAPRQPATVRLEVSELDPSGGVRRMSIADVPADDDRLREFARRVLDGESLSVHRWTAGPGRMFSRAEFDQLADSLTRAGFVVQGRGNKPRMLTERGRRVFRRLAE